MSKRFLVSSMAAVSFCGAQAAIVSSEVAYLGGGGRFGASFLNLTMADASTPSFELLPPFVWSFPGNGPITGSGSITSVISVQGFDGSFGGLVSASVTATQPPPPPPAGLKEPGIVWLAALALLSAAAARRGI